MAQATSSSRRQKNTGAAGLRQPQPGGPAKPGEVSGNPAEPAMTGFA